LTNDSDQSAPAVARNDGTGSRLAPGSGLEKFAFGQPAASALEQGGLTRAFNPTEIFRILNKWKLLILAVSIVGPLIALGLSLATTPMFETAAQIQINQEDPVVIPGANSAKPLVVNGQEFLATQIGLLSSRALAQRVVDAKRLANSPDYAAQGRSAAERRDEATERLRGQTSIEVVRGSRLVGINIRSPDPVMAAAVADSYAEQFIASNLDRDFEATSYARKFLEDRINSTRIKLEDSERELVNYAARQGIVELGGAGGDQGARAVSLEASSLIELNSELAKARSDRITAEQRYRRSAGGSATTESVNNPVLQDLTGKRAAAQAEYQEKLAIFLPGLPAMIALKERINALEREIASARGNVGTAARLDYSSAVARERELQSRVDGMKGKVLDLRSRSIQYTILQREVDTNRALYDALLQKYKEVGVSSGVGSTKVAIVDRARVPRTPVSPRVAINVMLGLLAGLLLGLGGAFLLELIDDTIKMPDDVRSKLRMTLLGIMPTAEDAVEFKDEIADPKSDLIEAAHSLRTALQFATGHGMPRSMLVTSSRPGEGKSSVTLALATSLARLGKRVLIIDADMRKPTFYVGTASRKDTPGLSNVLSGDVVLSAVTHRSVVEHLSIVSAGPTVPNPAALLSEGGFVKILETASANFDHVIVDGPPVMGLADAPLMGSATEGAVIVVEASSAHRSAILASVARLVSANTRVLGVVLNKFESRRNGYGDTYSYSYNYGDPKAAGEDEQDGRKIVLVK
jgi:polysaccharide biosynthesis transport protein